MRKKSERILRLMEERPLVGVRGGAAAENTQISGAGISDPMRGPGRDIHGVAFVYFSSIFPDG